jgi:hypothetical protein
LTELHLFIGGDLKFTLDEIAEHPGCKVCQANAPQARLDFDEPEVTSGVCVVGRQAGCEPSSPIVLRSSGIDRHQPREPF